jgi:hypothetical protein
MNTLQIKSEALETYKGGSKSELKTILFLTKLVKNLHTQAAIFFILLLIPMSVAGVIFYNTGNSTVFLFGMFIHFIVFKVIVYQFNHDKDGETLEYVHSKQSAIQEVLEDLLQNS